MTTVTPFEPPPNVPFQFNPTLDGQVYIATIIWGLFGRRWYMRLTALDGTLVFNKALIGSAGSKSIQSATWANGTATVTFASPHGYTILDTVDVTITGCVPVEYNGVVRALITTPTQLEYSVAEPLAPLTLAGLASYDINMVAGYFDASTLVYREAARQFEVSP